MPAPKMLAGLPKPVLFGLYGAVGGLLGALLLGELVWWALAPKKAEAAAPPPPEPRLAITATQALQLYQGGTNKLFVQILRDEFDDEVTVTVEELPRGVTAPPVTIRKGATEAEVELRAAFNATVAPSTPVKVVARASPHGKPVSASATVNLTTLASPMPQADIVFVLDVTGSMQDQIDGLKNGIGTFAADLFRAKIDARFGCLTFRDLEEGEPSEALKFKGEQFTSDAGAFRTEVEKLRAGGGGVSLPESSFEAISDAAAYNFRKAATRTLILITDAAPKIVDGKGQSVKATVDSLVTHKIDLLHLVINPPGRAEYLEVQKGAVGVTNDKGVTEHGKLFELRSVARNSSEMTTKLLPEMTKAIVAAAETKRPEAKPELAKRPDAPALPVVRAVQSSATYAESAAVPLVIATGVWTGAVAALVCLMLLGGQHHYLRGTLPAGGGIAAALAGGALVGLVGGAAGQGLVIATNTDVKFLMVAFRLLGWVLLGALAGAGLSLFVPNLKPVFGLAGGAAGGAVGGIGYLAVEAAGGDLVGRLAGGLLLGLFIGLMVAVVEAAFRRAWLEVRYGPREMVTVNLGAEPVKVGGDARACTVWARGAPEIALRYFIRDGKVVCTDVPARSEEVVADGDTRTAGNVTVVVRTGSGTAPPVPAKPIAAPPPIPRALPAKPQAAKADDKPPLLDSFDDDSPMPAPSKPAAPPPLPAKPRAAPAAPAAPVAKPPRDPDACPTCGRKTPGRPGSRYCMVCDRTY